MRRDASKKSRDELLACIKRGTAADVNRASQLIGQLTAAAAQQPFREQTLGGGPWQVVYTEGAFLWQLYTSPGKIVLGQKNRASQEFDPRPGSRSVLNFGEVAGPNVFVTAEGVYQPQESAPEMKGLTNYTSRVQSP